MRILLLAGSLLAVSVAAGVLVGHWLHHLSPEVLDRAR